MPRAKTPTASIVTKQSLAQRLVALRTELFGPRGGPEMARRIGIPIRSWYNYELGITVAGEVMLRIIELTNAEPRWLLHGAGPRYRLDNADAPDEESVAGLVREAIRILECDPPPGYQRGEAAEWLEVRGDGMLPCIADGAFVAFTTVEEPPELLDGKIVVAFVAGKQLVRWFHYHGRFACLRAERPASRQDAEIVIDLAQSSDEQRFRRVVQIITRHV
jgi:hypothetical protein